MAIKTFINGQENGVITFKDDTEPCAVYVNGERQDNISYIPTLAEGADSASYKSEYKNNLRTLRIEGNTEQESEYQAVEYIKSTGTQYVDTGVIPTIDTTVEIELMSDTDNVFPYGSRTSSTTNDKHCVLLNLRAKNVYALMGSSSANASFLDEQYLNLCKIKNGKDGFYINGDLVRDYGNITFSASSLNLYLFALNSPAEAPSNRGFVGNIYSCKIYDGNTLIRDYIPCYRNIDNAIGLYDLVNGVFYTNQGTGTFLKGADVSTQIGGTTNPTIANPAPITNCGNNNIEVVAKGINEFDISKIPDRRGNNVALTVNGNVINLTSYTNAGSPNGYFDTGVKFKNVCPNLNVGKTYRLTFDNSGGANKFIYLTIYGKTWKSGVSQIVTEVMLNSEFVLYGHNFEAYPNVELPVSVDIFDIMITEVQDAEYEPYIEPTTVSIPANVVLESGANETLLELAKIGDIADTITIDRVNNEVKYIQRICRVRPFVNVGGTLMYESYDSQHYNVDLWWFTLNKPAMFDVVGKCEFAKVDTITETETDFCVEIGNTYMIIGIPKSLSINTPEALGSYLMQTGNFGLSIFYVLQTPIEWEITDAMEANGTPANLKTMLLEWAKNTKNQTNIIEITSAPSVTKTSVNYAKWGGVPNENNT